MKPVLTLTAAVLAFAAAPAQADQVRFSGQTTADETLIRDALHNVLLIAAAHNCTSLSAVEAKILSPGYKPACGDATRSRKGHLRGLDSDVVWQTDEIPDHLLARR